MDHPDLTAILGVNAAYAEKVYADYLADPGSVSAEWRHWFETTLKPEQLAVTVRPPATTRDVPPARADAAEATGAADELQPLTGIAGRIVVNMAASLTVPTATSVREVPVKVLEENRFIINRHRQGLHLSRVSFTHLVAWAMVEALRQSPAMTASFVLQDGAPFRRQPGDVRLGIAVDLPGKDGRRSLVVPNIKDVLRLDFAGFLAAYDALLIRARAAKLTPEDFAGTTCTLTNPGTLGTVSSLPRLLAGQGCIVAAGAITVPAAFQGAAVETLTELGVSRVMAITSTYDHRVIQGAESGQFLDWMHRLLLGEEQFYERIFRSLAVPYRPVHFAHDRRPPLGSSLRETQNLERAAGLMTYIRSYRVRGHVLAQLNPLGQEPRDWPELDMSTYGLTVWDKEREFFSDGVTVRPFAALRDIQETLHLTYCRHVGVEYMHIADEAERLWLRRRMEGNRNAEELPRASMLRVLDKLVEAEAFEQFLHARFVGHKRFSLEGGDTLIPVLDALLEVAGEKGVTRVVLGMAHRGRLNVLANVLGKSLTSIFSAFEGWIDPETTQGSGDVKYHVGAATTHVTTTGKAIALELASNPSHLEAVNPAVEGMARAYQETLPKNVPRTAVLPVLVHGDAAFAGQGVVHETLQMSGLHGYRTGGTVHIVVNNQIGYTTNPQDQRSTPFCTDVAKGAQVPIFHVNGDDPLAAVRMIRLGFEYRMTFQRDVVVDIVCYRRHGHNEGDEPSFTQPVLYRKIEGHPTVRAQYQDLLLRAGTIQSADVGAYDAKMQQQFKESLDAVRSSEPPLVSATESGVEQEWSAKVASVPLATLRDLNRRLLQWPEDFVSHPKVKTILARRLEMLDGLQPIDFATAETLAFASLLTNGVSVRLAGQDSGRGTFSQRHATLYDFETGRRYVPLNHLDPDQAWFVVIDSLLSEAAALGFEYGYSTARPDALTLWEAQFGDFSNGAQVQIDQFLAAGEVKWGQRCGLVLLLPHGHDGQGPEHSSARIERFLQLCAENNLRVAVPSTAANYFHLLRRQGLDGGKKPLVVMTPKSLLRLKDAGGSPEELSDGTFAPVIDDHDADAAAVTCVICCSGKVFYDLRAMRPTDGSVALVRFELLYPWPAAAVAALAVKYAKAEWVWCQEEPANMGALAHVRNRLPWRRLASRPAAASPATGSLHRHQKEQRDLVADALRRR